MTVTANRMKLVSTAAFVAALVSTGCGGSQPEPEAPDETPETLLADDEGQAAPASSPEVKQAVAHIQAEEFQQAKTLLLPHAAESKDAQLHYYLGVAQANTQEVEPGIASLKRALELDPKLTDASLNLAALLLDLERAQEALAVVNQGLKHAPGDAALLENKALALLMTGDAKAAASIYAKVVEQQPNNETLRFTYAQALMEAEQSEAAAAQLELLKTSKGVAVLNSVADAFGRLKRYPDCVATVDAAIAIETKSELFVRRGVCKASAEDHAGATSDFKRAIEIDAQSATAHYYLGQSLKKKDKRGAKTAFNKAIALSGDNAKLKAAAEKALAEL